MTCSQTADPGGKIARARRRKLVDSLLSRDPSVDDAVVMPALFYQMMTSLDLFDLAPECEPSPDTRSPSAPPTAV